MFGRTKHQDPNWTVLDATRTSSTPARCPSKDDSMHFEGYRCALLMEFAEVTEKDEYKRRSPLNNKNDRNVSNDIRIRVKSPCDP
ncbi:unnamed protein product [Caenorhabditis brenneri]